MTGFDTDAIASVGGHGRGWGLRVLAIGTNPFKSVDGATFATKDGFQHLHGFTSKQWVCDGIFRRPNMKPYLIYWQRTLRLKRFAHACTNFTWLVCRWPVYCPVQAWFTIMNHQKEWNKLYNLGLKRMDYRFWGHLILKHAYTGSEYTAYRWPRWPTWTYDVLFQSLGDVFYRSSDVLWALHVF